MQNISTHQLVNLHEKLQKMLKKDYTGSGIRIDLTGLDQEIIGSMDFVGELLPELIHVLLKSLGHTLNMRRGAARSELTAISKIIGDV